jgi:hypothetical protein
MHEKLILKKITDFDQVRFVQDVQRLFETQGWLEVQEVA